MENSFNQKCYNLLRQVPKGKVTTYGLLAQALDTRAYRAVGNAMRDNPDIPKTPCHRVVNSDGRLGGYLHGLDKKIKILKSEGIEIENGKVKDFDKKLFSTFKL